jgi:hypothetical protein
MNESLMDYHSGSAPLLTISNECLLKTAKRGYTES